MTAVERYVLEWLAGRHSRAFEAAKVAEHIEQPLPKVTSALQRLHGQEFVAYYLGHPGAWAVTAEGRALIDGETAPNPTERFRMALEVICGMSADDVTSYPTRGAYRVAKCALRGAS